MPTVGRLTIALGVPLRYYIDDEPATPDEYFAASKAMDRLTGPCLECRRREQERLTPLLREAAASVALDGDTPPCPQCAAHAKRIAALEAREERAKAFDALEAVLLEGLRDGQAMLVGWTGDGAVSIALPDGRSFVAGTLGEAARAAWDTTATPAERGPGE